VLDRPWDRARGRRAGLSAGHANGRFRHNAARAELIERGVEVSDVQDFDWGSFVFFSDPDGNGWAVQQLPARE
jgi:hypothetical protein